MSPAVIGFLLILLPCNHINLKSKFNYFFKLLTENTSVISACLFCLKYFLNCVFSTDRATSVAFQPSHPKVVVEKARVEFNCSHNDENLDVMLWYQQTQSGMMDLIGYGYTSSEPDYEEKFKDRFKMTRKDVTTGALIIPSVTPSDSAVYFCACDTGTEAHFGEGTRLTVLEGLKVTPPTVRVLPASPKECGHQSKTIVCVASGFYPDHVSFSWTDKEGEVSSGVATDSEAVLEEGKTYMMSSRLRVSAEEWNNPDNEFTCTVHFFDGDKTVPYSASVKGIEDKYLKVTQSAKLTYSVFIVKSCFYGAFVAFLLLKFQVSSSLNPLL
uniref:Ig-like domain-containing protein n=1 Tax=Labrus bergylta TaxID=56723 RepID=A0A3Q3FHX1_9LABR